MAGGTTTKYINRPPGKTNGPRPLPLRELHRALISEWYLRGVTTAEMASRLGIALHSVHNDIRSMQDEWVERAEINIDRARALELQRIDELERTYWEAYERSCRVMPIPGEDAVIDVSLPRRSKSNPNKAAGRSAAREEEARQRQAREREAQILGPASEVDPLIEAMRVFKGEEWQNNRKGARILPGDPRFLAGIQWCIDTRLRIFRVLQPIRVNFQQFNFKSLTDEQLERLARGEDPERVLGSGLSASLDGEGDPGDAEAGRAIVRHAQVPTDLS